jgi:2'-5' RNA ligase
MEKYKEEEFGDLQVERVVLFKSDLRPTGPIYTALRELKFGSLSPHHRVISVAGDRGIR